MKLVRICAVGAFLCGPSFCHAQIQFLDNVGEQRSILVASEEAEHSVGGVENPFDFTNLSPSDQSDFAPYAPSAASAPPAANQDPSSLPVGIHHRRHAIDRILQQGIISQIPHSAYSSVAWPGQLQADNPTARVLLYNRCGIGLWDNYAAEQAAQCAAIQASLMGHHGGCAHGSCARGTCHQPMVFNRYTNQLTGCDSSSASVGQNCQSCVGLPAATAPLQYSVPAPIEAQSPVSLETPKSNRSLNASLNDPVDNVARLPTINR